MILKNIRKRLKLFSILSSLILLLPTRTSTHACGYGDPDEEEVRFMLFNPDLLNDKAWWTFFYSRTLNYLDGETFSGDDEMILTDEWIKYLKVNADAQEAQRCLFGSLSDSLLELNSFYKMIVENPKAKEYFAFAKQAENLNGSVSNWDKENQADEYYVKEKRIQAIEKIGKILESEKDSFFERKYAFQLLRLSFYSGDSVRFDKVYNKYFLNRDQHVLDWWAMHYKSMMSPGTADSSNYLHARVFSHSSNKMFASKNDFSSKNIPGVLSLARNGEERAEIYLLKEVINPGRSLEGIRKVYELSPSHRHLPLLIGREINKLEHWLGSRYIKLEPHMSMNWNNKPVNDNWKRDYEYLVQFITLMNEMPVFASEHSNFYNFSLVNLLLMKGDAVEAGKILDNIRPTDPVVNYQKEVFRLVSIVEQNDIRQESIQNKIGEIYSGLISKRGKKFESEKILYSLSSYLRYSFSNKGMIHLAGLFNNYAQNKFCATCGSASFEYSMIRHFDEYASAADMEKLIEVYDDPSKNKLEEVLLKPYSNKNYLLDLLAVKYLRNYDVKNAKRVLDKIPDDFWNSFMNASENLTRDPFNDNAELMDVQTMESYNKREIIEKMFALEQEATANKSVSARNYFLLGNAWYNFSANSWFMISYAWSEGTTLNPDLTLIARRKAKMYYTKALEFEAIEENKAKLIYMIALLSEGDKKIALAKEYERYDATHFYNRRNCLTLSDLARMN